MVTKTLLFGGDGPGLFSAAADAGGFMFRAYNKQTGAVVFEMKLPAHQTGVPMTYMVNGRQTLSSLQEPWAFHPNSSRLRCHSGRPHGIELGQ
jgi:hypothetical protein